MLEIEEPTKPICTLADNRPGNQMLEAIPNLLLESKSLDVAIGNFEVEVLPRTHVRIHASAKALEVGDALAW